MTSTPSKQHTIVNLENFHHDLIRQPCPAMSAGKVGKSATTVLAQHITASKSLPATGVNDDGPTIEALAVLALAAAVARRLRHL